MNKRLGKAIDIMRLAEVAAAQADGISLVQITETFGVKALAAHLEPVLRATPANATGVAPSRPSAARRPRSSCGCRRPGRRRRRWRACRSR